MDKPVLLVVDDAGDRRNLAGELRSRYGSHYRVEDCAAAVDALARLAVGEGSLCVRMVHDHLATATHRRSVA